MAGTLDRPQLDRRALQQYMRRSVRKGVENVLENEVGRQLEGKHYDFWFEWSDERIYCSELVWKIYRRGLGIELGELCDALWRQRFAAEQPTLEDESLMGVGELLAHVRDGDLRAGLPFAAGCAGGLAAQLLAHGGRRAGPLG